MTQVGDRVLVLFLLFLLLLLLSVAAKAFDPGGCGRADPQAVEWLLRLQGPPLGPAPHTGPHTASVTAVIVPTHSTGTVGRHHGTGTTAGRGSGSGTWLLAVAPAHVPVVTVIEHDARSVGARGRRLTVLLEFLPREGSTSTRRQHTVLGRRRHTVTVLESPTGPGATRGTYEAIAAVTEVLRAAVFQVVMRTACQCTAARALTHPLTCVRRSFGDDEHVWVNVDDGQGVDVPQARLGWCGFQGAVGAVPKERPIG